MDENGVGWGGGGEQGFYPYMSLIFILITIKGSTRSCPSYSQIESNLLIP